MSTEQEWALLVTYARAAGASSYDVANEWVTYVVADLGVSDLAAFMRHVDAIAEVGGVVR